MKSDSHSSDSLNHSLSSQPEVSLSSSNEHPQPADCSAHEVTNNNIEEEQLSSKVYLELQNQFQVEIEKYRDLSLRATADLENYRKRIARERENLIKLANINLLEKIIPILDHFQLGIDIAKNTPDTQGILDGFLMIHKQLFDLLVSEGLKPVNALGEIFNPNIHEALGHEQDHTQSDGVVLREIRQGFFLGDKLIRPASVIVNHLN